MDLMIILLVAAGTFALRTSFIVFAGDRGLPAGLDGVLDNIKPAAMAAIATAAMTGREGLEPIHFVALVLAGFAAKKGADLLVVIIVGMAALVIGKALT